MATHDKDFPLIRYKIYNKHDPACESFASQGKIHQPLYPKLVDWIVSRLHEGLTGRRIKHICYNYASIPHLAEDFPIKGLSSTANRYCPTSQQISFLNYKIKLGNLMHPNEEKAMILIQKVLEEEECLSFYQLGDCKCSVRIKRYLYLYYLYLQIIF